MSQSQSATVIFLGTGTSVGVPAIGCDCAVCQSSDPRDNRTRCAIIVELPGGTLLIDTPPDLRTQFLREKIPLAHAVLFTHEHADHLFGLDDVRLFPFRLGSPVPLYCEPKVEKRIRHSFDYAFSKTKPTHPGARPQLEFHSINENDPFEILGASIIPIPLKHGPNFDVLGFRIGDFAYCTDTNEIPPESLERLQGVKTFVVGALRHHPHPTHFSVNEAIEVAKEVKAERTLLTHLGHDLGYRETMAKLPNGIELAYDGLRLTATL
ncbi:Phosphoribosyl 1,2-cyclic phosphodiesterase [Rubripirellula amarantea]|uniref:Phosphoribosyl 1,2-cyclic phosphodiesterase n=1 Tax=Rubripirellula amarantea TaxID=2527999 RepID=A0A5C5WUA7_9BACT|nr:MBL fold metallo-hydrolase [Rubripirellula amarantea]TWT54514.1 Phosphoribosyl 1,2-cyclic phosphodiesterase [Rubripirellula amarantea]